MTISRVTYAICDGCNLRVVAESGTYPADWQAVNFTRAAGGIKHYHSRECLTLWLNRIGDEPIHPRPLQLSKVEVDMLRMAARGLMNKEIAVRLHLHESTVKNRFTALYQELGVGTRIEAVIRAIAVGAINLDDVVQPD